MTCRHTARYFDNGQLSKVSHAPYLPAAERQFYSFVLRDAADALRRCFRSVGFRT